MKKEWFSDYKEQIYLNNIKEAQKVLLDNINKDQMIYKYCRGLNRDLDNLENHKLWMSSVFNFNDPYDCLVTVDCGLKATYQKSQRKDALETYMRQVEENRKTEALQSSFFVACFTELNDSFPLWGYYAAEHKGICLGYSLYDLIKNNQCMPVIYSKKFLTYKEGDSNRNILANTLTKSKEWIHEKEWRIVVKDDSNNGKGGIIKDFIKPKEIYIGCRQQETVKENNLKRKQKLVKEAELYADINDLIEYAANDNVKVYMPVISRKEYKMIDRGLIL